MNNEDLPFYFMLGASGGVLAIAIYILQTVLYHF
jgi:hypothetical protein